MMSFWVVPASARTTSAGSAATDPADAAAACSCATTW